MIFSKSWLALMRRNTIYKKRKWISTILELVLPIFFIYILVIIKNIADANRVGDQRIFPELVPGDYETITPLSYKDYGVFLQSRKVCMVSQLGKAEISGVSDGGYNWQIPFMRCHSGECEYLGQSANTMCEYMFMALSGTDADGMHRAEVFRQWFYNKYPVFQRHQNISTADLEITYELTTITNMTTNVTSTISTPRSSFESKVSSSGMPFDFDFIQIFDDPTDMDAYTQRMDYGHPDVPKIAMGIVFEGNSTTSYRYSLRQNSTNFNFPEEQKAGTPSYRTTPRTDQLFNNYAKTDRETCTRTTDKSALGLFHDSCTGLYLYNGVLATQRLVGDFILQISGATDVGYGVSEAGVSYTQFPQEPYVFSGFFTVIEATTPIIIVLGLLYPVAMMIAAVVSEKELRQKELMKMMSMAENDIGMSWFVTFALFHCVTAVFCAYIANLLYEEASFLLLWGFWTLTFMAIVNFAMAMAATASKTSRGVLIGILLFFTGVFFSLAIDYRTGNYVILAMMSIHPVAAMSYGIKEVGRMEDLGIGLTINTIDFSDHISGYSFRHAMWYVAFDIFFWGIVAWYLNRVITPDYGQGLPYTFPLQLSYWFPSSATKSETPRQPEIDTTESNSNSTGFFEPVCESLKRQSMLGESIEIHNLRKSFGKKHAVNGLTMSMYKGQITALLGHNGAGKTTTINMLTGAMAPSAGRATVAGKDVRTQLSEIRKDLGICLQHDCLFPLLTVREHVQFYARLKGLYDRVSLEEAEKQIDQAIIDVALSEKRHTMSKNLSGGMKRKLSVAIAFCGGSKVVLLDEPTSGMDPFSRRFTWDVIRQYRQDRCIILTTHFMDEADILGDRIAIMGDGQLKCAGSSLFLKNKYGVGYQLTVVKSKRIPGNQSDDEMDDIELIEKRKSRDDQETQLAPSNVKGRLHKVVMNSVPHAKLQDEVGSEVTYQLPFSESSRFGPMFSKLDKLVDKKRIDSYGVSVTTLNEVFLLVTRGGPIKHDLPRVEVPVDDRDVDESNTDWKSDFDIAESKSTDTDDSDRDGNIVPMMGKRGTRSSALPDLSTSKGLFMKHLIALLKKRATYFRRDKKAWICTTILPSLFVLIGFTVITFASPNRNLEPLTLNIKDYNMDSKLPGETPIVFNSPNSPFTCQPGSCSHVEPFVENTLTGERYLTCGLEARLGISAEDFIPSNQTCTIEGLRGIMDITDGFSVEIDINSTEEGSLFIRQNEGAFASSTFGALWFSHDSKSRISNADDDSYSNYTSTVINLCEFVSQTLNYTEDIDCDVYKGVGYVIQYNYTALHAALLFEQLANEALLREATKNDFITVETTIAPLPITPFEQRIGGGEDAFVAWFLVVLSFPFIAGAYASFIVTEKQSKAKHLQTVAGVEPSAYWLSTFMWDVFNYQFPLWIIVAMMFIFKIEVLITHDLGVFQGVMTLLCLFGPAAAGFTYCLSYFFNSASLCNIAVIITGFLTGMGGPLVLFTLKVLARDPRVGGPALSMAADRMAWFLRIFPTFNLGKGLFTAINIESVMFIEEKYDLTVWSPEVLRYEALFLLLQSILLPCFAVILDHVSTNPRVLAFIRNIFMLRWLSSSSIERVVVPPPDDDDVLAEKEYVRTSKCNHDLIVMNQLSKVYNDGKVAVDNMSLSIAPGECFGLLGINGAGKTTTMGMLTAEFPPSGGDAILSGFSVMKEPEKIRRRIGYCPQFDAHFANLTGREHVELYASIKGISKDFIARAVSEKLEEVGLNQFDSDRLSSVYSGGMKRRLSLACATIGQPQIIFLDECSTGVDPVARREIWQLVSNMVAGHGLARSEKPSVILTTHSMDECEALCPRIGIMANGRLRCLGSAQHLKNKFGRGYQVETKPKVISPDDKDLIEYTKRLREYAYTMTTELEDANTGDAVYFDLANCRKAITIACSEHREISDLVCEKPGSGYAIWKDASSPSGVPLDAMAAYITSEVRVQTIEKFIFTEFPNSMLRERQDLKSRYEVDCGDLKISTVFAAIECNKQDLCLADYSVSQTSLEQVFNVHAKEAEERKAGRLTTVT